MNQETFELFQLEVEKKLGEINSLVDAHTPEFTDANYLNRLGEDLDRVIKTIEEHHG